MFGCLVHSLVVFDGVFSFKVKKVAVLLHIELVIFGVLNLHRSGMLNVEECK
jgi:hypothetical protein